MSQGCSVTGVPKGFCCKAVSFASCFCERAKRAFCERTVYVRSHRVLGAFLQLRPVPSLPEEPQKAAPSSSCWVFFGDCQPMEVHGVECFHFSRCFPLFPSLLSYAVIPSGGKDPLLAFAVPTVLRARGTPGEQSARSVW